MTDARKWMLYGATGYTGRLVAREARQQGLSPILAGRSGEVAALAAELGLTSCVFPLTDIAATRRALDGVSVVAHCAGPFAATSAPMIDACLLARANYVDITGEIDVFVAAQRRHAEAQAAGIVVCPGVGFDVIPTDCVAACLVEAMPDATHLALGFKGAGSRSPGTARTSVEGLRQGARVRKDGAITGEPLGQRTRIINFGAGPKLAVAIPWGDVATAYFTTGIANIEVYVPTSPRSIARLRRLDRMRPLLRLSPLRALVGRMAARNNPGPSQKQRDSDKTLVWGEVRNANGDTRTARLTTSNGYRLTVDGVLMAVRTLLARPAGAGGYFTPTQLLGARCVERLPGCSSIVIE
jgi:short subunit dehydrogenase-like uncharacterized protein